MNFEGVIFDLDGTLVDSLEDIADSMNAVLKRRGFPTHDYQAYPHFIGNGLKNLVRQALPEGLSENDISESFEALMEEYRKNCTHKTHPYDGIAELLDELSARPINLAVFSNKVDELARVVVRTLLPRWHFKVILGATPEIPRKPNPKGALWISRKMGISPEQFIYVGDSHIDMETATNARMYAVGVPWGYRTKDELMASGAKKILTHPLDLLSIVGRE